MTDTLEVKVAYFASYKAPTILGTVRAGEACVACKRCGQGRLYSETRGRHVIDRRWTRHVCPRGAR